MIVGRVLEAKTTLGTREKVDLSIGGGKMLEEVIDHKNVTIVINLEIDAINLAIGAVLSQKGKPVAFFSETLNEAKR